MNEVRTIFTNTTYLMIKQIYQLNHNSLNSHMTTVSVNMGRVSGGKLSAVNKSEVSITHAFNGVIILKLIANISDT